MVYIRKVINLLEMNQIQLVREQNPQTSPNRQRMEGSRPDKISVNRIPPGNKKWTECKVLGKNISIRSYAAGCVHNNKLYIYGGYQILNGIMDDFCYISLDRNEEQYSWVVLERKGDFPGPRARHALLAGKDKLYLFAGLSSNSKSSNQLYEFNIETQKWNKIQPDGEAMPHLDSFGSAMVINGESQKIIIFGGYNQDKYEYSNVIYEYDVHSNKWSVLHRGLSQQQQVPSPRSGCGACSDGKSLFIFGGKNDNGKLNDMWEFNLESYKFLEMHDKSNNPVTRNGHTLNSHNGILYLFGGIHDITWELDDLHIYNLNKKEWVVIQQDSPRKIEAKRKAQGNSPTHKDRSPLEKQPSKKKPQYETSPHHHTRKSPYDHSPTRKASNTQYDRVTEKNHSPAKMIDEQRRKAFLSKKAEMLKNFNVNQKQKDRLISMETTSQAMKNTLDVIGNPGPGGRVIQGKLADFGKTSVSKFLQPLSNNDKDIVGKRPCARDGHVTTIIGNEIIVFGGDRHQMSFNDIYRLDLAKIGTS